MTSNHIELELQEPSSIETSKATIHSKPRLRESSIQAIGAILILLMFCGMLIYIIYRAFTYVPGSERL